MIDIVFDGVSDAVDFQIRHLIESAPPSIRKEPLYYRFQGRLRDEESAIDDTNRENIRALKIVANSIVEDPEKERSLVALCERLKTPRAELLHE